MIQRVGNGVGEKKEPEPHKPVAMPLKTTPRIPGAAANQEPQAPRALCRGPPLHANQARHRRKNRAVTLWGNAVKTRKL